MHDYESELLSYAECHHMLGILTDEMTITLGAGPEIRSFLLRDSWIDLNDGFCVKEFCWEDCAKSLGFSVSAILCQVLC